MHEFIYETRKFRMISYMIDSKAKLSNKSEYGKDKDQSIHFLKQCV